MLLLNGSVAAPIRAADVMQTAVVTVSPDLSLAALEDLLLAHRIGGAPVVERGKLVGVVSRSDVVRALSLERSLAGLIGEALRGSEFSPGEEDAAVSLPPALAEGLRARTVRDAMATDPITVSPDTTIAEVAKILIDRHVHRVLVTANGALLGVLTSLDIARLVADRRLS